MICHHCPGKTFTNETEFEEHCAKHRDAQIRLRRKPRTYGARTTYDSASDVIVPSSGPILPVASEATQGSLPLSTLSTNTHHEGEAHQSNETQNQDLTQAKLNKNDELNGMLARFMSQDKSFIILRRFSTLNIQNLLHLQSEILRLEKDVLQAERDDSAPVASVKESISEKLHKYNAALLQYSQILELHKPESISVSDLRRWISDVAKGESAGVDFLADEVNSDLASLVRSQTARNRAYRMIEDLTWRLFTTETTGGKKVQLPKGGTLHIFDDQMIHMAFRAIMTLLTFLMLLTPIVALSFMEGKRERLALIVVCTAITATVMAVATNCREHEIMMAASTYAAVLMIYMN